MATNTVSSLTYSPSAEFEQNVKSLVDAGLTEQSGVSFNKFALVCFDQSEKIDDQTGEALGRPDWNGDRALKKTCQDAHKAYKAEFETKHGLGRVELANGGVAEITRYSAAKAVRAESGLLVGQDRRVNLRIAASSDEAYADAEKIMELARERIANEAKGE